MGQERQHIMGFRFAVQSPIVGTFGAAVWGDEVMAVGLAKALAAQPEVDNAVVCDAHTIPTNADVLPTTQTAFLRCLKAAVSCGGPL